jgi:hypothetical protein
MKLVRHEKLGSRFSDIPGEELSRYEDFCNVLDFFMFEGTGNLADLHPLIIPQTSVQI